MSEAMRTIGEFVERQGETWRTGEGAEVMDAYESLTSIHELLVTAYHALRSYQYGNESSELAKEVANEIQRKLNLEW